jgi:hypothetical protein
MSKFKSTEEFDNKIVEEYLQGKSTVAIHKEYGITIDIARSILKRKKIKMRTLSQAFKKYHFNDDFFAIIDTEAKAYFLGIILTDGYIGDKDVVLELNCKDRHIIETFVECVNGNNKIHEITKNPNTTFNTTISTTSRLSFRSNKMVQDLRKLGIEKNKTFNMNIPKLPEHLERHFWRGVLDGDGYVSICKARAKDKKRSTAENAQYFLYKVLEVGICGHINTVTSFSNFLEKNNILASKIFPDHSIFSVRVSGSKNGIKFLNLIYSDSDPKLCLKRKYEKYLEYLEYKN